MTKALYIFSFLMISHFGLMAQTSINDYKYVVIPVQFEFLKERDQYQINSLTKFLFNKYGYEAYIQDEELPEDLRNNRCLGLYADVIKENAFLKTKLQIDLKDCNGTVVKSSKVGETREKEYATAYNLAIRDAFTTFQNFNYSYQPNASILASGYAIKTKDSNIKEQAEITRLKNEIKSLKEDNTETVAIETPKKEVKAADIQLKQDMPKESTNPKKASKSPDVGKIETSEVLYAQGIDNGFQLVDQTPKVVMVLYYSGMKDVFIVKGKDAIVFKKGDIWVYSENKGADLKAEAIDIKF